MLSSSLYVTIKLSKKSSTQKVFDYDCVTLYPPPLLILYKAHYFYSMSTQRSLGLMFTNKVNLDW